MSDFLQIELKEDSLEKLASIFGKPTKNYLFAQEINQIVQKSNELVENKADLMGGKVPAWQLPSYVDDVLEFASFASLPANGEMNKIYIITAGVDANKQYRWSGSGYVELTSGSAVWGSINGSIATQADLIALLNAKQNTINALENRLLRYTASGIVESIVREIEGKIGVGMTPQYPLDVAGTIRVSQELLVGTYLTAQYIKGILSNNGMINFNNSGIIVTRNVNDDHPVMTVINSNNESTGPVQVWKNHLSNLMTMHSNGSLFLGTSEQSQTALFQMNSTTKGFLPPRMTTAQRDGINSPSEGLMIFNTSSQTMDVYTSSGWKQLIFN